jgi:hypothetical protein
LARAGIRGMISALILTNFRRLFRLKDGSHGQLIERYAARLVGEGLVLACTWRSLSFVGDLMNWIARNRSRLTDINELMVERYLDNRARRKSNYSGDRPVLKRFLSVLREPGMIAPAEPPRRSAHAPAQRQQHTIASYRDTFRLLLQFARARLRRPPSALVLENLDAPFVNAFLGDLEKKRGASVRTRNLRLTAIRIFFRFVSFEEPARSALIQRVLAIPSKRHDKRQVHFLTRPEIEAILALPDRKTWLGHRDHTLLLLAVQTGFASPS